jgi:ureidoacrylate peracid hydrolase
VNASTTVLLVVDMQNSFCHPDGITCRVGAPLNEIDSVISNLAACIDSARARGIRVTYTRQGYAPDYCDQGKAASSFPIAAAIRERGGVVRGTWDHAVVDALAPQDGDIVIDKTRLDSFLHTPLESILHNLGIESIVIGGCVTNFCVETTVRSAWQHDFDVTVIADATASFTPEMHERSLTTIAQCFFAAVKSWREVFPA